MAKDTQTTLYDGFVSLEEGMDSCKAPNIIKPNQCSLAINTILRGGFAKTRYGFRPCTLDWKDKTSETNFLTGKFQGVGVFTPTNGNPLIIVAQNGRQFRIDPLHNFESYEITLDVNSTIRPTTWMQQVEDWFVIQDGLSKPLIYDGATMRRAVAGEVPMGCMMAYGMGRLWVTSPDRRAFYAGDIVYGSSGTSTYNYRDAALKFTENTFLAGGGAFGVPSDAGKINSMRFLANLDTSLGQGPLQVFTTNSIFSVNTPTDRTVWQNLTNPIQTVSMLSYGGVSHEGTILVNGDVFYRSTDGIRSFKMARARFNQWGNKPISSELDRIMRYEDCHYLDRCSAVLFDNRIIFTASPVYSDYGVYHRGLFVLDLDIISGIDQQGIPAYDGLWTGFNILRLFKGDFNGIERCFAMILNASNQVELWELDMEAMFDDEDVPIKVVIESASYPFGNAFQLKRLESARIWYDQIVGNVTFTIYFRSDQSPCWTLWHTWSTCADYQKCDDEWAGACQTITNYKPQYRTNIRLPQHTDACDENDPKPARIGYEFQVRLEITGKMRLKQFRMEAIPIPV